MKPRTLRRLMNVWPPYLASGIRVRHIADDWREVRVELVARFWNRNYVGTHFGGSLFAMTDPFYMLMYLNLLGPEYIVWDYAASIRFVKPGRGTVRARFELDGDDLQRVHSETVSATRFIHAHEVSVLDENDDEVARISRELYFRRKSGDG